MTRPTRRILASGIAAWDADADFNFSILTDGPFPMVIYDTTGDLPTASSYTDCLALVGTTTVLMYISDGTTWSVYRQGAVVADSTATTAADMATDFNELLTSLKDAGLMATS